MSVKTENVLVAYFSHIGQNYSNRKIIDLKKGNTEVAAEFAAEITGGTLFEIKAQKEYPYVYNECTAEAQRELKAESRPAMADTIDISGYDVIILGYPCWCGTMPMVVWTFLTEQGFAGKTILPICTNEGSGMGNSEHDLKKLCPDADIRTGLSIHGSSVSGARPAIEKWLKENLS